MTPLLCPCFSITRCSYVENLSRDDSFSLNRNLQIGNSKSGHLSVFNRDRYIIYYNRRTVCDILKRSHKSIGFIKNAGA